MIVVVFLHQREQMYKNSGNEDKDVAIDILYFVRISKLYIDDH